MNREFSLPEGWFSADCTPEITTMTPIAELDWSNLTLFGSPIPTACFLREHFPCVQSEVNNES
jgi:hypothetical protein